MFQRILHNKRIWLFVAALFSSYALFADFAVCIEEDTLVAIPHVLARLAEQLKWSVAGRGNYLTVITIALFCLYQKMNEYATIRYRKFALLAGILSFLTILYYPYELQGTIRMIWATRFQAIKTFVFFLGYGFLFYFGTITLYQYIINDEYRKKCGRISYWQCAGILALCWLPHLLVKIPGGLGGDTESQIWQALGFTEYNSHQPIFLTWLLKIFFWIGRNIWGSNRAGMFMYFLVQSALLILAFSYTLYFLSKKGVSLVFWHVVWLIYALSPFIVGCVGVISKDMLYAAGFLLFIICCVRYIEEPGYKLQFVTLCGIVLSGVLTILARNNGKEIIYPTTFAVCLLTIWHNRNDRRQYFRAIMVFALPILCAGAISNGLVRYYHITSGSIAEALSFPFQQTARVVYEHGEELPEKEKDIIDVLLGYNDLADRYDPLLSDPVKFGFKAGVTREDLFAYGKVWLQEGIRYPMTYLDSVLNQNYPLFSVLKDNCIFHYRSGTVWEDKIIIAEYPFLERIEQLFIMFYELCFDLPIISLFSKSSFYCVLLVVLTVYVWCDKKYKWLLVLFPLWLTIAVCILGPAIMRHPRYTFPIVYSLPFIVGCYMRDRKDV